MNTSKKQLAQAVASITFSAFLLAQPALAQGTNQRMSMFVSDSNTGYIDNAVIHTRAQLRYDNGSDMTAPDRAEFFYGACGCARDISSLNPNANPNAPGPSGRVIPGDLVNSKLIETSLDYQQLRLDYEHAFSKQFSVFAELPLLSIDGEVLGSQEGLADMHLGLKWGLLDDRQHNLTFQFKAYLPTGDSEEGLGTDHYSVEPGLLYFGRLGGSWTAAAELRYLMPIDGTSGQGTGFEGEDYSGDVLRTGIGVGYDFHLSDMTRITPVLELVSWKVLGGLKLQSPSGTPATAAYSKADDTITNVKLGLRATMGKMHSVYLGYGTSVSDADWYEDIVRLEYRRSY